MGKRPTSLGKKACLLLVVWQFWQLPIAFAMPTDSQFRSSPIFQSYFSRFLSPSPRTPSASKYGFSRPATTVFQPRRTLANEEDDANTEDIQVNGMSVPQLRGKIAEHQLKLARLRQESKDLAHERAFLEKTIELKKGQRTMQDGQVKLSQAELEDKAKEIEMYKREAPRTLMKYNELVRKQKQMQDTLNRLHQESEELSTSKNVIMEKIQHLNMEDLIERHARGLPDAMAGALRKSAAALVPFFDYLMIAADTNNRLVDHVGAEIDKYTHVNISKSPFMSGILFYCVLLIPLLTLVSFVRRVFDSSSKLTVSHYIIFGNLYFVIMCVANVLAAFVLSDDPMNVLFHKFERTFIVGNLFLSGYYCWHVLMLGLQAVYTLEKRNISQFLATLSVGIHYFLFAWRRIFTDHAPMMYTFNYLVYGTIFCFILYERYNRMSRRQLNDSIIFRIVQLVLKRRSHLTTMRGIKSVAADVWSAISMSSPADHKGYSKRHDRHNAGERGRNRVDGRDKEKARGKAKSAYSSDDNEQDGYESPKRTDQSSAHYRKTKYKHKSNRTRETKSFINMFFGSREDGDESSDGVERPTQTGGWRFLSGAANSAQDSSRGREAAEVRSGRSARRHRSRDKREPPTRASLWKWS